MATKKKDAEEYGKSYLTEFKSEEIQKILILAGLFLPYARVGECV